MAAATAPSSRTYSSVTPICVVAACRSAAKGLVERQLIAAERQQRRSIPWIKSNEELRRAHHGPRGNLSLPLDDAAFGCRPATSSQKFVFAIRSTAQSTARYKEQRLHAMPTVLCVIDVKFQARNHRRGAVAGHPQAKSAPSEAVIERRRRFDMDHSSLPIPPYGSGRSRLAHQRQRMHSTSQ